MDVLVLHLSGPMQSWGASGRLSRRDTAAAPTKSAVVGLLAACLGRPRGADVSDIAALTFAVRTDRPGTPLRDYHTIGGSGADLGITKASGGSHKDTILSERWYLADAAFTAALGGDDALVATLAAATRRPRFAPYLGRRSCPTGPGWSPGVVRAASPLDALVSVVPLVASQAVPPVVTVCTDDEHGALCDVADAPRGTLDRHYDRRRTATVHVEAATMAQVPDAVALCEALEVAR